MGLVAQLGSTLHHDAAWYLIAGARYLEGGTLYRDVFVDVNPPLGMFLTLPPVVLARLMGAYSIPIFIVYVYLLIVLSLAVIWQLQRTDTQSPAVLRRGMFIAAAVVLIVSCVTKPTARSAKGAP